MYFFFRFLFGNKIKKIPDRAFENTSSLQIMYVTTESSASFILLMPFYYQHLFLIYSLLCLSLLTLKSRFSFSFSSLQNNNITRIPDYAFKNQRSLEVMYVRKWLPLVVVTIRYAFCTVTWEDHRFRVILSYWKEWPKVFQNQNIAYSFVIWKQLVVHTQANTNQLNNIHEKITQFWLAEKGVQFLCNTNTNL